jgi:GTP 3',8-cyclase
MVGVCIQRMDLCRPVDEFVGSQVCAEIVELRENEDRRATQQTG